MQGRKERLLSGAGKSCRHQESPRRAEDIEWNRLFQSKTGILTALLDQSMFGPDYDDVVRYARSATDAETRLRRAAVVARQIRSAQSVAFESMRGAGVVAPELANTGTAAGAVTLRQRGRCDHFPTGIRKASGRSELSDSARRLLDAHWRGCISNAGTGERVVRTTVSGVVGRYSRAHITRHLRDYLPKIIRLQHEKGGGDRTRTRGILRDRESG
jgi:hypothetical protein